MLPESKLLNFIDHHNGLSVHFLEGQKLIHDLAIIHDIKGEGFSYFRHSVLTAQPMIAFLKSGEGLGIFLDSEIPYFRLKIEMSHSGQMRTLLFPENFDAFPTKLTGKCRVTKSWSNARPYTSIIELASVSYDDIVNKILHDSYQVNAKVILSEESDQSILLLKFPPKNVDKQGCTEEITLQEYWSQNIDKIEHLFSLALTDEEQIISYMKEHFNLSLLNKKDVIFKCTCSTERVVDSLVALAKTQPIDDIFLDDKESIETRCDYCKTSYLITKETVLEKIKV